MWLLWSFGQGELPNDRIKIVAYAVAAEEYVITLLNDRHGDGQVVQFGVDTIDWAQGS